MAQYLTKQRQQDNETWSIIEYSKKNIFFKNYLENDVERLVPDLFLFFQKA